VVSRRSGISLLAGQILSGTHRKGGVSKKPAYRRADFSVDKMAIIQFLFLNAKIPNKIVFP